MALPGFVMFGAGMAASEGHRAFVAVGLLGFALFGGSILYMMFSGRCVHCRRLLGRMFAQSMGSPVSIASDLQFCPYCGASLDEPPKA
jgi:hypothetical protein